MGKPFIELITCDDWEIVRLDLCDEYLAEGHSISNRQWLDIIGKLGFEVKEKKVSNKDMENGKY